MRYVNGCQPINANLGVKHNIGYCVYDNLYFDISCKTCYDLSKSRIDKDSYIENVYR